MTAHANLSRKIEALLPRVSKPTRYLGNELNAVHSNNPRIRVALCFPEVYEIGMSWPGQQILYNVLNSMDGVAAERVYAFWPDMEKEMRAADVPAFSLESWTPLAEFDILGFTLQYELIFTNILTILDLARIPLRSNARRREDPLIIAGGPVAYNCEPIADFLDAIALGDGEDVFPEICRAHADWKASDAPRSELLARLARISGVYVPSLYTIDYNTTPVPGWHMGAISAIVPTAPAPPAVRRRFVEDLNRVPFPEAPIVPLGRTVHDRLGIEVQRGCTRACRFCQAGYIYRPERQRDPEQVKELVARSLQSTGYDEVSLLSLSIGDYGCLDSLLGDLLGPDPRATSNISVSLPSIRVDTLQEGIVDKIASARKTGFTMAPEAGSPRLRDVINKALSEEQIARAAEMVFQRGWSHIKFYYMIGLPTETDEDVMGIVRTARMCQEIGRRYNKRADIHVSTSTFVPKPFTPFQWEPQVSANEILRKQAILKYELKKTGLTYRWHDSKESFLEAVLSRGDRRLGDVVEHAFRNGARFDGWKEYFNEATWQAAFAASEIEPGFYAHRRMALDEVLPWDHIDCGVTKDWLKKDLVFGERGKFIPDCATGRCYDCGVCDFEVVKNRTYVSQETDYRPQGQKAKGMGAHPVSISTTGKAKLTELLPKRVSSTDSDVRVRYRVHYAKEGRAAYIGHLDMMDHIARALKRAGVVVAYSQGFHPKPKLSFGPALMTGAESTAEFFDMEVMPPLPKLDVVDRVNSGLPDGLRLHTLSILPADDKGVGLEIEGATFHVTDRLAGTLPPAPTLDAQLKKFQTLAKAEVTTPKKTYDVKPYVASVDRIEGGFTISIHQTATGSAKPTDVVRAILGWDDPRQTDGLLVRKVETAFRVRAALLHANAG